VFKVLAAFARRPSAIINQIAAIVAAGQDPIVLLNHSQLVQEEKSDIFW